jgi:hypothetical protein
VQAWFEPPRKSRPPTALELPLPGPASSPPLVCCKASAQTGLGTAKYIHVFKNPATVPRGTAAQPVYTRLFKPPGGHVESIKPLERPPAPGQQPIAYHAPALHSPPRHPQHSPETRNTPQIRTGLQLCPRDPGTTTRHTLEPTREGDPGHTRHPPRGPGPAYNTRQRIRPGATPARPHQPRPSPEPLAQHSLTEPPPLGTTPPRGPEAHHTQTPKPQRRNPLGTPHPAQTTRRRRKTSPGKPTHKQHTTKGTTRA